MASDLEIKQVQATERAITQYSDFLQQAYSGASVRFSQSYLKWLYAENPDGIVRGFDAWDGTRLAAHYVCIPICGTVEGDPRKGLLSLNTATHPEYQGRGLFTKLAAATYEAASADGYDFVVGVANANSTHGFVKRLRFQLVSQLHAMLGVGRLGFDRGALRRAEQQFSRSWSEKALRWRLSNPIGRVEALSSKNGKRYFYAATHKPLVSAWSERLDHGWYLPESRARSPASARLFLGAFPSDARRAPSFNFIEIPPKLRPAPLNLIYRPLNSIVPLRIDAERCYFDFLDFDAF